jgi:DNA-binding NtrC family response regulator
VEDEEQILQLGQRILQQLGYNVLVALMPQQAIDMARQYLGPIHLLATDVVMPGMNGKELKEQIERIRSGIKYLYISGYTADIIARHGVFGEELPFLQKPFTVRTLSAKVREALDS